MKREFKQENDILTLDDSGGCYITVTLPGLDDKGYLGVNLRKDAGATYPYAWSLENYSGAAPNGKADGITSGNPVPTIERGLADLVRSMTRQRKLIQENAAFDPARACKALHEWMEKQV